jgi:hypothetical protein
MTMHDDELVRREAEAAAADAARIGGDPAPDDVAPAERPVREAGGGEAEGFEESEAALADHAAHGDLGHSPRNDAFAPEVESDLSAAEYGEGDHEQASERVDLREDAPARRPDELPGTPGGHDEPDTP